MVKKFFRFFNSEFSGVSQAALLLAFFSVLSQILGLVRDRALAHFIGPSDILDVYYASFRIPDLMYVGIASFASATIIIPFLSSSSLPLIEKFKKSSLSDDSVLFLKNFFTVFFFFIVVCSVIAFIFMPFFVRFVAPGFSLEQSKTLISLSRIMLLSPIFLGISNLFSSVTQYFKKFVVFASSALFYNLGIIFGVILLYPIWGIKGVVVGVIIGALMHLCIQIPTLIKHGFIPSFSFSPDLSLIKKVVKISIPRTLGLSINALTLLVMTAIISTLREGSISIFNFSFHLQAVPLTVIGTSYAVAAFPTLSRLFSENNRAVFFEHLSVGIRHIFFWSFPVIALFVVLRAQIVRVILGSGSFSWTDTRLTAAMLAIFCISSFAQSIVALLVRGYYAAGKTWRPLGINTFSFVITIGLSIFFLKLFSQFPDILVWAERIFRLGGVLGAEILAFPLAFSIGAIVNMVLIIIFFKKDFVTKKENLSFVSSFWQSIAVAIIMGIVAYYSLRFFSVLFDLTRFWGIFIQGLLSGLIAIFVGGFIFYLFGNREFLSIKNSISKRFFKAKIVVQETEDLAS